MLNQDTFKNEMFTLLKKYKYEHQNLKQWEQLRVHQILNELYTAVNKTINN